MSVDIACLAPNFFTSSNRPTLNFDVATSNTLQLSWQDNSDVRSICGLTQFSLAPLVYTINLEYNNSFSIKKVSFNTKTAVVVL